jgi:hypothetical protein
MITQDQLTPHVGRRAAAPLRSAFTDARQRLPAGHLQQTYLGAKGAFDKKDYVAAVAGLHAGAGRPVGDPDIESASAQPPLADLRMLATGFHDLALKAVTPAPPLPAAPVPEPVVERTARV